MLSYVKRKMQEMLHARGYSLVKLTRDNSSAFLLPGHLASLFGQLRINCVVDVGANEGQYGLQLRRIGFSGRIASFEPSEQAFRRLKAVAEGDPDWHVYRMALGSSNTKMVLNVCKSGDLSSLLKPNGFTVAEIATKEVSRVETVEVRRLDSVLADLVDGLPSPRIFLKCDTQGYDLEVFEGARNVLGQILAAQSEISFVALYEGMPDYIEALTQLRSYGFAPTGIYQVLRDGNKRLVECDVVMLKN